MKKAIIFIIIAALVLTVTPALIFAGNNGPAKKATGGISIYEPWDGGHREVSFNAHEAVGNKDAKGKMVDDVYGPDGVLRRVFEYDVKYVRVDGDYAYFGAYCTNDSKGDLTGEWLYIKVQDGGTPGTNGDYIGWKWGSETQVASWVTDGGPTGWWRLAIGGNLVVHTY